MIYGHFCCCRSFKLESPSRFALATVFNAFSLVFSLQNAFKRPSPDPFAGGDSPKGAKKAKPAAKKAVKKKKDPNEPQK